MWPLTEDGEHRFVLLDVQVAIEPEIHAERGELCKLRAEVLRHRNVGLEAEGRVQVDLEVHRHVVRDTGPLLFLFLHTGNDLLLGAMTRMLSSISNELVSFSTSAPARSMHHPA